MTLNWTSFAAGACVCTAAIMVKDHLLRHFHRQCGCGSRRIRRTYKLTESPRWPHHHHSLTEGECEDCGAKWPIKFEMKRFLWVELWWRRFIHKDQFAGTRKWFDRVGVFFGQEPGLSPKPRVGASVPMNAYFAHKPSIQPSKKP